MDNKIRDQIRREISRMVKSARILLFIGAAVIVIVPYLLTQPYFNERFNFSETGQIGDTIGGVTAPFLNLIGAILVFYALKAQVRANLLVQEQIENEIDTREKESEGQRLDQLYSYLRESIDNFRFESLPTGHLKNLEATTVNERKSGGDAFVHLFSQIQCHYHGSQEELHSNQSVAELLSILKVMSLLLDKLAIAGSNNREILLTLTQHLFQYKVTTRLKDISDEDLELSPCSVCQISHGMPNELRELIVKLRSMFELQQVH